MSGIYRAKGGHPFGYTPYAEMNVVNQDMQMDFGVLRLRAGDMHVCDAALERAFLLVYGEVTFEWAGKTHTECRDNCFDVPPTALHVPMELPIKITAVSEDAEIAIMRTENINDFEPKLYLPGDTPDEYRGAGTMMETSTRIVRTIFDYSTAPYAKLVLGEVIGFPGKWSSYPPHHHPQPEIYYYKTNPEQGFGYAELGENVYKVKNNDVLFIGDNETHPHSAAPGYALWYLWVIRHLDGDPYITPTFLPEHLWVVEPGMTYWPDCGDAPNQKEQSI